MNSAESCQTGTFLQEVSPSALYRKASALTGEGTTFRGLKSILTEQSKRINSVTGTHSFGQRNFPNRSIAIDLHFLTYFPNPMTTHSALVITREQLGSSLAPFAPPPPSETHSPRASGKSYGCHSLLHVIRRELVQWLSQCEFFPPCLRIF